MTGWRAACLHPGGLPRGARGIQELWLGKKIRAVLHFEQVDFPCCLPGSPASVTMFRESILRLPGGKSVRGVNAQAAHGTGEEECREAGEWRFWLHVS
ncbi:MAG: hypothetical protein CMP28_11720 [Roseibacillus sp.]|nr:hypothetical protein [Roseibacillus sp.]